MTFHFNLSRSVYVSLFCASLRFSSLLRLCLCASHCSFFVRCVLLLFLFDLVLLWSMKTSLNCTFLWESSASNQKIELAKKQKPSTNPSIKAINEFYWRCVLFVCFVFVRCVRACVCLKRKSGQLWDERLE